MIFLPIVSQKCAETACCQAPGPTWQACKSECPENNNTLLYTMTGALPAGKESGTGEASSVFIFDAKFGEGSTCQVLPEEKFNHFILLSRKEIASIIGVSVRPGLVTPN